MTEHNSTKNDDRSTGEKPEAPRERGEEALVTIEADGGETGDASAPDGFETEAVHAHLRDVNHAVSVALTGNDHLTTALRLAAGDESVAATQELRAAEETLREASADLEAVARQLESRRTTSDDSNTEATADDDTNEHDDGENERSDGTDRVINTDEDPA